MIAHFDDGQQLLVGLQQTHSFQIVDKEGLEDASLEVPRQQRVHIVLLALADDEEEQLLFLLFHAQKEVAIDQLVPLDFDGVAAG